MTAPTHTSFGILSLLSIGAMMGRPATLPAVGLVTIGALLPDIDTAQSTIGRLLFPLSAWLERRLGHRGAVHSLFALMVLGFATVPLAMSNRWWWMALLIGFGSHLLLDTLNKEGVPLFYPSRVRAVMPRSQRWRIAVGSKAEMILMTVVSIFALLLLPINRAGLFQSLHALLKDIHSAIADYRAWENAYRVIADVEGGLNISQQPIAGAFEVLGVENANSLVVFDETRDALYTVGTDANANIYPKRILCRKGEPIQVITHKVHLENELLGNLLDHLPKEGQTFIKGTLKTTDRVILPKDPDHYDTIQLGINEMNLQYARARDLEPLDVRTIFVIAGDFYIRTILPVRHLQTGEVEHQATVRILLLKLAEHRHKKPVATPLLIAPPVIAACADETSCQFRQPVAENDTGAGAFSQAPVDARNLRSNVYALKGRLFAGKDFQGSVQDLAPMLKKAV